MISATVMDLPDISMAFVGQTSAHLPHIVQSSSLVTMPCEANVIACSGHAATHVPQLMHFVAANIFSGLVEILSGLWHQEQCRLQPLKNTTTRIPGPSLIA
jgi:hypothetical protein